MIHSLVRASVALFLVVLSAPGCAVAPEDPPGAPEAPESSASANPPAPTLDVEPAMRPEHGLGEQCGTGTFSCQNTVCCSAADACCSTFDGGIIQAWCCQHP